jgi:type III pantothenate kinase
MNLLIDSGNTKTKAALCNEQEILEIISIDDIDDFYLLAKKTPINHLIISSVNKEAAEILKIFPKAETIVLSSNTPVPIQNLYETPSTLGMDRLADVIGASTLFPNFACLCIDAGTCITYDIIDEHATYLGGSISPGIDMRFKALHTFTAKLPLIHRRENIELTGNSTENSILSGVLIGITKEIEGIMHDYKTKYQGLKVIITGGDAGFFESRIKEPIFAKPELLFLGLKRILEYNAL